MLEPPAKVCHKMADTRERCACLTKAGTQCKNTASEGSLFCWRHAQQGCAKQVGGLAPERRVPSPPRRAASSRRSPSPRRSPRTAVEASPAYFDQLDDTTLQVVCDKLAEKNDYRTLGRLIGSGKRFWTLCQSSLDKLEEPPTEVDRRGTMRWRNRAGQLHRTRDKPARIRADGRQAWFLNGQRHRGGDKPARIWADGTQEWWFNGHLHREGDKPAVVHANGSQEWWVNGQRHRGGDQPAYIGAYGTQEWWVNGHRIR